MKPWSRCLLCVLCLAVFTVVLVSAHEASAQADEPARRAAAQALFDEAMQLLKLRDFARACPKLEEVNSLQPGKIGAMMELGACYEAWGKITSAWARYRTASDLATKAGDARKAEADAKVAELGPKVPRLVVVVPESMRGVSGLVIETDGVPLGPGAWGTGIPVDPGAHEVAASAPDKRKWSTKIEINRPGDTITVTIPMLAEEVGGGAPAAPAVTATVGGDEPHASTWSGQKTGALIAGGVGVLGLAAGIGLVVAGVSKYDASEGHCNELGQCNPQGFQLRKDAIGLADAATVAFIVSGVALAGGVTLWLTAPSSSKDMKTATKLTVGPGTLSVAGSF